MDFFLDTANVDEIRQGVAWGILDGVTTNPSLMAKTGRTFDDLAKEIVKIVKGPVNLEVMSDDHKGMIAEAHELVKYGANVVVKIPMTEEGMVAVKLLAEENIPTNVTLIFSPMQALIAAKAGAAYVSPFLGRLDDISQDGLELIEQIRTIYDNYGMETQIIAASLRHPMHVVECAMIGADIGTIPMDVMKKLFKHPLTDKGVATFKADYAKIPAPGKTVLNAEKKAKQGKKK
jgi:transaldolase